MLNENEESSSWMVNFKFLTFVFKRNLTLRHTFIKPLKQSYLTYRQIGKGEGISVPSLPTHCLNLAAHPGSLELKKWDPLNSSTP